MGDPQLLRTNGAQATKTLPFASRAAGQSLHTMVRPPICGMLGPCVHVPVPV